MIKFICDQCGQECVQAEVYDKLSAYPYVRGDNQMILAIYPLPSEDPSKEHFCGKCVLDTVEEMLETLRPTPTPEEMDAQLYKTIGDIRSRADSDVQPVPATQPVPQSGSLVDPSWDLKDNMVWHPQLSTYYAHNPGSSCVAQGCGWVG